MSKVSSNVAGLRRHQLAVFIVLFCVLGMAYAFSPGLLTSLARLQLAEGGIRVSTGEGLAATSPASAMIPAQTCTLGCSATVPASGTAGQPVSFQATGSPSGCATGPNFQWSFGNGDTSSQQNPSYTYNSPGVYNWQVTVTASQGGGGGGNTISTAAGGEGEGVQASQVSFTRINAIARDPLGRGVYVGAETNADDVIYFINTSSSPVTLAGRTFAAGEARVIAGGGALFGVENVPALDVDLARVNALAVSTDATIVYFIESSVVRALNVGTTTQTIGGGSLGGSNVRSLATSGFGVSLAALAVHPLQNTVFASDATLGINRVFRIVASTGVTTTIVGNGAATSPGSPYIPGQANSIPLLQPLAIEFEADGSLIVSDTGHSRILKVSPASADATPTLLAQYPFEAGSRPFGNGLAVAGGIVFVVNGNSQTIVQVSGGTAIAGQPFVACDYQSSPPCGDGGQPAGATFALIGSSSTDPQVAAADGDGNGIFLVDQSIFGRARIRYINRSGGSVTLAGTTVAAQTIQTIAGKGLSFPFDGGASTAAYLSGPVGVAVDANNNLWSTDSLSVNRLRFHNRGATQATIFSGTTSQRIVPAGATVTVNADPIGAADVIPAINGSLDNPQGLFITSQGVYVADSTGGPTHPLGFSGTNTAALRFINTSASTVTFYPGSAAPVSVPAGSMTRVAGCEPVPVSCNELGFARTSRFVGITDVAVNANGDMFVTAVGDNVVRRIDRNTGNVTNMTVPFSKITGIGMSPPGRLYIVDTNAGNLLRETSVGSGTFTVLAGGLSSPRDVAIAGDSTAYVTTAGNHRIIQVTDAGVTSTFAGTTQGFSGDGGAATSAKLNISPPTIDVAVGTGSNNLPQTVGIGVAATGDVFFADPNNNRIRRIGGGAGVVTCIRNGTINIGAASNPVPGLTSINPTTTVAGGAGFQLTVNGSNYLNGVSVVRWNGQNRTTTFINGNQLQATILTSDLATAGVATVTVFNSAPGGGTSGGQTFTITNPAPSLAGLTPSNAIAGGLAFNLTVNGNNFVSTSVVNWNGSPRTTTFNNTTTLTAAITLADIANPGTAAVTVVNPAPGGGTSNTLNFTISTAGQGFEGDVAPRPTGNGVTSLLDYVQIGRFAASLDTVNVGSEFQKADCAPKDTLGNGGVSLADWVQAGRYAAGLDSPVPAAGGPTGPPPFAPPGENLPTANLVAGPEQARIIRVVNTSIVRGQQGAVTAEIVSQGNENTVGFSLDWDESQLSFVSVALAAGLPVGTQIITNTGQTATGRLGAAVSVPIGTSLTAGTRQLIVVTFNALITGAGGMTPITFVDSPIPRELVDVSAGDIPLSQAQFLAGTITLNNPVPTVTTLNPPSTAAGSAQFTLTVNGTNFVNGSIVRLNGVDKATTFVNGTQLTATILASDVANAGTPSITVFNPTPAGGLSNGVTFTVTAAQNPVPAITTLNPTSASAGGAAFVLTVNGSNFAANAIVRWNGADRVTTFVNANQVSAQITQADIAAVTTAIVTVFNPVPGGGTSNPVNFPVTASSNPVPAITSLNPNSATAGGVGFTLTVNGNGFASTSVVRWNGSNRMTTFANANQVTAQITAADIAGVMTNAVTVFSPAPGGGTSNVSNFSVTSAPTSIVRAVSVSVQRGQNVVVPVELVSTGLENAVGFTFQFDTTQLSFVSATGGTGVGAGTANIGTALAGSGRLTVTVAQPPGGTFAAGTRQLITVTLNALAAGMAPSTQITFPGTPTPNEVSSVTATLLPSTFTPGTITFTTAQNPVPALTSLNPSTAVAGSAAFTLIVNGSNFLPNSVVRWNGADRTTTFVNANQVSAAISAADIAAQGTATVVVFNPAPGGGTSNVLNFTITSAQNPGPTLTSLVPNSTIAGGAQFQIQVNGSNFVNGATVLWNGAARTTTFVNSGQLTATILASDIATGGTANVTVVNPAPGGGTSSPLVFTINNAVPTLANLTPASTVAGSAAFQLSLSGTNFTPGSTVRWNGSNRVTTFLSPTSLQAAIGEGDLVSQGSAAVTVVNPAPGGGTSNVLNFTISSASALPVITSIQPNSALAGGPQFPLGVNGSNFGPSSKVHWNGSARTTTFDNANRLTAIITTSDIAQGGTATVTVVTPGVNGGTSNPATFNVQGPNPTPSLTSLNPSSIAAGTGNFTLNLTGSGFVGASMVKWNGADRPTTFVNSMNLTAQIPASDVAAQGTASVTVVNPGPGGGISNELLLTITPGNPVPALTSLNPSQVASGSGAFVLTVNGSNFQGGNFVPGAVVNWNGSPRTTTFGSSSMVTAQITAADVANGGTASVTVTNPAPGGGISNILTFTIVGPNPVPVLTSLNPPAALVGGPAFVLLVNGTGFVQSSVVNWNGSPRTTTFVNSTQLQAQISAADIAAITTASITVFNPAPGGGTSNALTFAVGNPSPVPVLTSINPNTTAARGPQFTITVTGSGFVEGSRVLWNGADRPTTFVNSTTLTALIPASDIVFPGTASITVFTQLPGGGTSSALSFSITNPVPALTSLNPSFALFGSQAFSLQLNGTNFVENSVVRLNGQDRVTTFVNASQLTAQISAADIAQISTHSVTVFNPTPGGGLSNALSFFVVGPSPAPILTGLIPAFANVGGPAFELSVIGMNFAPNTVVQWNGSNRVTTFVSTTNLRAQILASDISFAGSASVRIFTPAPGGGFSLALRFAIARPLVMANAASFVVGLTSPESIVAAFGDDLATGTASATSSPLPTLLLGTSVLVRDQAGVDRAARLFSVSDGQVNFETPPGTSFGTATITITSGDGVVSIGQIQVLLVAPGIFSANSNGTGVAAADVVRVQQNGSQTIQPTARFDPVSGAFVPVPIVIGPQTETLFLVFYGTGVRGRTALTAVSAQLGGTSIPVLYAGATPGFTALDQVNLGPIARAFIGRGTVNFVLTVDGRVTNTVTVTFQ